MTSQIRQTLIALLLFVCAPDAVNATTVLRLDLSSLLNQAALIFEGEVITSEAQWNPEKTRIVTLITFSVRDVIKGDPDKLTITVSFAGGTVDDTTLQISGMVYPAVGETGIYFFEDPGQEMVNPLLGWGQGHFRVKTDSSGKERVLTEDDAPVLGVDSAAQTAAPAPVSEGGAIEPAFSRGTVKGIRTGRRDQQLGAAMEKEQFKASLKAMLTATRSGPGDHGSPVNK